MAKERAASVPAELRRPIKLAFSRRGAGKIDTEDWLPALEALAAGETIRGAAALIGVSKSVLDRRLHSSPQLLEQLRPARSARREIVYTKLVGIIDRISDGDRREGDMSVREVTDAIRSLKLPDDSPVGRDIRLPAKWTRKA